jgi:nucleotide-binding universal stress UspA family protein
VAEGFGAKLVLLTVLTQGSSQEDIGDASEFLDRVASTLRTRVKDVQPRIASGDPRAEIVALAHSERRPVVVMSTRGASGLSRWVLGSVADGVARTASVPTMVVPPVGPLFGPAIH